MRKVLFLLPVILLVSALIFGGCAQKAAAPGVQEIRLGCNSPMTGVSAGFGIAGAWGGEAAVDDVNKLGGVYVKDLGKKLPLKIIVVDNESSAEKSGAIDEDLILNQKVNFQIPPNQILPLDIPQAIIADKYKIPRITGGNPLEPWLAIRNAATPPFEYTWTHSMAIATPAPKGSPFDKPGYTVMEAWKKMLDQFGGQTNKKIAIFASDEPDGRGWYLALPEALGAWGYTPIGIDKKLGLFPPETTDFSSIVREWISNDCQILWGNCVGPVFGTVLRQCYAMGFKPKMVSAGRAALFWEDVSAWGGELPNGVGVEIWWDPALKLTGFGDTTPQTLAERWTKETGHPLNRAIVYGYWNTQILVAAIEKAGSIDPEKVNKAIPEVTGPTMFTDITYFDADHETRMPVAFGQWQKVDQPWKWECKVIFSDHKYMPVTAEPIFPIP
jgi:branched-chain amino acid transport system substrate-binding protein